MKYRNTIENRIALEVVWPSGKQTDYVEPFGLSFDYSDEVIRNSRDLQVFIAKKTLVPVSLNEAEVEVHVEKKPILEEVGNELEKPGIPVGSAMYMEDEATLVSKAPDKTFAEEKTMSQVVDDAVKAAEKVADVVANKDELIKQQDKKIKDAIDQGLVSDTTMVSTKTPERVAEFNKLQFFAKKSKISKETDKSFLGELLACVNNANIKALVRQRISELK